MDDQELDEQGANRFVSGLEALMGLKKQATAYNKMGIVYCEQSKRP